MPDCGPVPLLGVGPARRVQLSAPGLAETPVTHPDGNEVSSKPNVTLVIPGDNGEGGGGDGGDGEGGGGDGGGGDGGS